MDKTKTKRRSILRLAMAGVAALCCLVTYRTDKSVKLPVVNDEGMEYYDHKNRRLLRALSGNFIPDEDLSIPNWLINAGQEGHPALEEAMKTAVQTAHQVHQEEEPTEPYNIIDAIHTSSIFRDSYGVLVYDNIDDEFVLLYMANEILTAAVSKLRIAFVNSVYLLREIFPDRFCGKDCYELAIPISSGDFPHLHSECFEDFPQASPVCTTETPILHFGSVFKSFQGLPHMIAMPMPIPSGLVCFSGWIQRGKSKVCCPLSSSTSSKVDDDSYTPQESERKLSKFTTYSQVFKDGDTSKKWDELIPQVIWRGSNFQYMGMTRNGLRKPREGDIPIAQLATIRDAMERRKAVALSLGNKYDQFIPRWKGVILTAHAEINAEENHGDDDILPWADMKFAGDANKDVNLSKKLLGYGIADYGEMVSPNLLADYRYQIDIGGGGGTTWTGTHQKLAMPGLLFHHSTVTKDYIHDRMKAYIHYVPVKADLSDLKEKYNWAEANPSAAKLIADQGTQLMRHIGTVEGFGELFDEHFVKPVQRIMNAYEPVSATHPGKSWREVIKQAEGLPDIAVRTKCVDVESTCTDMGEVL